MNAENLQFRGRKERGAEGCPGSCRWLDMGGLYRREALDSVGYLSNRNFHSCEEQELGLRLSARGWRMRRLSWPGVRHHGHTEDTFSLQRRRLRSGYLYGPGEMLRASLGKPWLREVVKVHRHLLVALALWIALVAGVVSLPYTAWPLLGWARPWACCSRTVCCAIAAYGMPPPHCSCGTSMRWRWCAASCAAASIRWNPFPRAS